MYQGTKMRIKVGGKPIFHETEASLSSNIPFKEVASKDTTGVISTPGTQNWSITSNSLIANGDGSTQEDIATLYAHHAGKLKVQVEFTTDESGDVVFSGDAYVENFNVQATHEEEVTGDFSFKGDGGLSIAVVA